MDYLTVQYVKQNNYSLIYHLIYQEKKLSKQDIANRLHKSLPTVTQNLTRLEQEGLIEKSGQFAAQIGRKAAAYNLCERARVAVGVEILKSGIRLVAVDLYGSAFFRQNVACVFLNNDAYYCEIGQTVQQFIEELQLPKGTVLGIGFAVQALTSSDGGKITYGNILNFTGTLIDVFQQHLKPTCKFFHDAGCAATTELWVNKSIQDAVFFSVGKHLGGALILNQQIHQGEQGKSGTIEHMTLIEHGKPCYCGKRGCMEAYCSLQSLLKDDEPLEAFFTGLRAGEPERQARWNRFLDDLSIAVNNLHMVFDSPCILGGHIAPFLTEEDIAGLHERVYVRTSFPNQKPFIRISSLPQDSVPIGAALPFLKSYLDSI
ncbi:MAG: ROK family protein [Ruminiclostridium sp.]